MKNKQIKAEGEFIYDYKYDILTFKTKNKDYKSSIEFHNFIVDIDAFNFVSGIRIMDASKISGLNKIILKNMKHANFEAEIKGNLLSVRLNFIGIIRNRLIPLFYNKENITQQFTAELKQKMPDSKVTVTC
jgi:hypothetical protein